MKKALLISVLVLAIVGSVIAGTLANYTITIDALASGSVIGKAFVFTGEGTDSFEQGVKIAPTETVVWQFSVKNYEGLVVTETNLYYRLTFSVRATSGKQAIMPLVVTVKDAGGNILGSVTGIGSTEVLGEFLVSTAGQSDFFTVEAYWPSNNAVDIDFEGDEFGSTINVGAFASQMPLDGGGGDDEDPPAESDVSVLYEAGESWVEGAHWDPSVGAMVGGTEKYEFRITLFNNGDEEISNWQLAFLLPDLIYNNWEANRTNGVPAGGYTFNKLAERDPIAPGSSFTFGGHANGTGETAITSVTVNGVAASVENRFNVDLDD